MILNLETLPVKVLLPKHGKAVFNNEHSLLPFGENTLDALSQLGIFLMKEGRHEPSIVAAGYWLRKKHLLTIKSSYPVAKMKSQGVAFHIAPGNVDTLFFYSLIISVLCGNQTILRISRKLSEETQFLIDLIVSFFQSNRQFLSVYSLMNIIQYDHNDHLGEYITRELSLFADVRVIWGGDNAVQAIAKIPTKNLASTVTFPDRYSVAVIQLGNEQDIEPAVNLLLTDIKPFYQQACSSPRIVYWLETPSALQKSFWHKLALKLNEQVHLTTTDLVSQLVYLQRLPLLVSGSEKYDIQLSHYGALKCIDIRAVTLDMIKAHCGLWNLFSIQISALDEMELFEHCQTVTISGVKKSTWLAWQCQAKQPMKRVVPAGQALAFSHVWDGIDLVKELSKECNSDS